MILTFNRYGGFGRTVSVMVDRITHFYPIDYNGNYGTTIVLDTGKEVSVEAWSSDVEKAVRAAKALGECRPPTPPGWSDTDWLRHLKDNGDYPHPLGGMHINRGSMDAAADAYEAEYRAAKALGE